MRHPSLVAEQLIFRILWEKLPKKSFISGLWLRDFVNTPFFDNLFTRVLSPEVGKYEYFRFYLRNIVLLTAVEKELWLNGTEEQRIEYSLRIEEESKGKDTIDWKKLKDLETVLINEYKKYFPTTRGIFINYSYNIWEQKKIIGALNEKYVLTLDK